MRHGRRTVAHCTVGRGRIYNAVLQALSDGEMGSKVAVS